MASEVRVRSSDVRVKRGEDGSPEGDRQRLFRIVESIYNLLV